MAWIGWQAGMSGPPVAAAKKMLKRKFSYAAQLNDDEFFGWDLQRVLAEYQRKKGNLRTDGVLDYATQKALGTIAPKPPSMVGTLFCCQGTGATMWQGYPADVGLAVQDVWHFQPVGDWPAKAFPMGPSVELGRASLKKLIRNRPGKIALAGYSQGAMVTAMTFRHDILNPRGELHDRLPDIVASVTWGNPCREKGVANGNRQMGIPIPEGRGIADAADRLVDTPAWWYDYAHGANSGQGRDIYTDTPDDDTGENMTAIYRAVQRLSGLLGPDSLAEQIAEMVKRPVSEIPAALRAIYFGGQFITARPFATAPHCTYSIQPAIDYLRSFRV